MKAVCEDFESAPISEAEKGLLRYLVKVNDAPATVTQEDVDAARSHGWSDHALFDALTVASIFNFFNRWLDGAGLPDVPEGFYEKRLREHGAMGYRM